MKKWFRRTLLNSIFGACVGFFGIWIIFLAVTAGAIAFRGATIESFIDFWDDPTHLLMLLLFSVTIGCIGFISGLSSLKLPETEQTSLFVKFMNKFGFLASGSIVNALLLPLAGPIYTGQGYFECLPVGLFLGIPVSIVIGDWLRRRDQKKSIQKNSDI